jgi:hypothetical protein
LKIYIAAPYSGGDVAQNIRNAVIAAEEIVFLGHTPYVPHLMHLWHMIQPHPIEFWYRYDFEWLAECDALLRLEGESVGADAEVKFAESMGIPVFHRIDEIPAGQPEAQNGTGEKAT